MTYRYGDDREKLAAEIVDLLNDAMAADATALHSLVINRVPCNDRLMNHPAIVVDELGQGSGRYVVGLLGIINGLLPETCRVAYVFDDDTENSPGLLRGFKVVNVAASQERG